MAHSLAPKHGGSGDTAAGDNREPLRSPQAQAAHYRDYAAQIRALAATEQALRGRLTKIAREYEDLTTELAGESG
jgi:hypothetical protein